MPGERFSDVRWENDTLIAGSSILRVRNGFHGLGGSHVLAPHPARILVSTFGGRPHCAKRLRQRP